MMAVVDASVWVDALLDGPRRNGALLAVETLEPWAPQLIDSEVVSAIARLERAGVVTSAEADTAMADWGSVRVERASSDLLLDDVWALRHSIRTTDAFYVVLARILGCPLITSDARLARAPVGDLTVTLVR
jgi:predicted nucleic acid-binding protein